MRPAFRGNTAHGSPARNLHGKSAAKGCKQNKGR